MVLFFSALMASAQMDIAISGSIAPTYVTIGHSYFQATITNEDTAVLHSITLAYSGNGSTPVNQTFSGLSLGQYHSTTLRFSTPFFFLTATTNRVTVTCSAPNGGVDPNASNNSMAQNIISLSHTPEKHVLVEEFSTTRCGFCPGGYTRIQQIMQSADSSFTVPVTIHAGFGVDAMTTNDDTAIANTLGNGCPTANIDRLLLPGQQTVAISVNGMGDTNNNADQWNIWKTSVENRRQVLPPCSIYASNTYDSATRVMQVTVSAHYYGPATGPFRINCYVIEDSVTGVGAGYDQNNSNYSSPDTTGGILNPWFHVGNNNVGGVWAITGYVHHRVVRAMLGGAWGSAGVIPGNTTDGGIYTKTYPYTLPAGFRDKFITLVPFVCEYYEFEQTPNDVFNVVSMPLNDSVVISAPIASLPSVLPMDTTVCLGSNVSLLANGGIAYLWSTGDTTASVVANIASDSDYTVTVTLADSATFVTSAHIAITPAPAIQTQPVNEAACPGSKATFSVQAAGTELSYQWKKNGADISGATSAQYVVANVSGTDTGSYTVVITGACPATSNPVSLILSDTLVISSQPTSQTICVGSPVTFNVIANGLNPTYQWFRNGNLVSSGSSDSITINNPSVADSGNYSCSINSACGNATSQSAILIVKEPSFNSLSDTICPGTAYNFNGNQLTNPGIYSDTFTNALGCDSFVILSLNLFPLVEWNGPSDTIVAGSLLINLTGGTPTGGNYSGDGVVNNAFYPDSAGPGVHTLTYSITEGNGCTDTATKNYVVIVAGINNLAADKSIKLYPDPVKDMLFVEAQQSLFNFTISIFDPTGKIVVCPFYKDGGKLTINTSNLSPGVFYIRLQAGSSQLTNRFVKLNW